MDAANSATQIEPDFSNPLLWQPVAKCMLCGGRNFREIMKAPDPHYGMPGLFPIFRCEDCSLQFLNPQPTMAYLSTAYPTEYYSYLLHPLPTGWRAYVRRFGKFLKRVLVLEIGKTRDPHFEWPGTMLDIGCGAGDFLIRMRAEGWKVHGVEISAKAAEAGRSQGNLEIVSGTLLDAHYPEAFFDYVRTNHSFEHIHNPREVLKEIRRIIKPEGKLFIGVPNIASLPADLFGDCWYNLGPPTHPYGYCPKSLSLFLKQEGFEVESVGYNSTFSGLLGSIQIRLNRGKGLPSDDGWVFNNPILTVFAHWVAKVIDAFKRGDCIEVIARPKA